MVTIETQKLHYIDKLKLIGRDARLIIVDWAFWVFGYGFLESTIPNRCDILRLEHSSVLRFLRTGRICST